MLAAIVRTLNKQKSFVKIKNPFNDKSIPLNNTFPPSLIVTSTNRMYGLTINAVYNTRTTAERYSPLINLRTHLFLICLNFIRYLANLLVIALVFRLKINK